MNHNTTPTVSPNHSLKKFLAVYEKMVRDSWSLARQMAASMKLENRTPKNSDRPS